jgi:hypothetical protein
MDGEFILLHPDGRRETLASGRGASLAEAFEDFPGRVLSAAWDADGSLWVLDGQRKSDVWVRTILHGRPGERLRTMALPADVLGWQLAHRGPQVGLLGWSEDNKQRFTPFSAQGAAASRSVVGETPRLFNAGWAEQGLAATASQDRMSLSWRGQTWRMPERIVGGSMLEPGPFPAVAKSPAPVFAVNVMGGDGKRSLVLCKPGAKPQQPWPGTGFYAEGLSGDGSLWGLKDEFGLLLIRPDGSAAPVLNLAPALAALPKPQRGEGEGYFRLPVLLRAYDSDVWVMLRGRWLARIDAQNGTLKGSWRLPARPFAGKYSVQPVEKGFFFHDGERTFFMDWEGQAKKLI